MVVGLTKNPKRVTKNSLKRVEEKLRKFESAGNAEVVNKMKRVGVFIKTYNMSHLLVTRYYLKLILDIKLKKTLDQSTALTNQKNPNQKSKISKLIYKEKKQKKKKKAKVMLKPLKKNLEDLRTDTKTL